MTIYELIQDLKTTQEAQKELFTSTKSELLEANQTSLDSALKSLKSTIESDFESKSNEINALIEEKAQNATKEIESSFATLTENLRSDNERLLGDQLTIMANFSQNELMNKIIAKIDTAAISREIVENYDLSDKNLQEGILAILQSEDFKTYLIENASKDITTSAMKSFIDEALRTRAEELFNETYTYCHGQVFKQAIFNQMLAAHISMQNVFLAINSIMQDEILAVATKPKTYQKLYAQK